MVIKQTSQWQYEMMRRQQEEEIRQEEIRRRQYAEAEAYRQIQNAGMGMGGFAAAACGQGLFGQKQWDGQQPALAPQSDPLLLLLTNEGE